MITKPISVQYGIYQCKIGISIPSCPTVDERLSTHSKKKECWTIF